MKDTRGDMPPFAAMPPSAPPAAKAAPAKFDHTTIRGRFNQYTSAFWSLAIPMLSARYIGRWTSNLFKLHESDNFFTRRAYGFAVGAVMAAVTSVYAKRTVDDMKTVFKETVGWETGKNPADVGVMDLWRSKNAIVDSTMKNFLKYNARRALMVNAPFFNFLIPGVLTASENPKSTLPEKPFGMTMANSVDLGVGTTGLYLASDVLTRKETFFEAVQRFTDQKINHSDKLGDQITAADLINLFELHVRESNPKEPFTLHMNSPEWQNNQVLFGRMAELMNQTYGNSPDTENANFTIPKLIYLLGENIIDPSKLDRSLTYIEIASKYDIPAVKQVHQAIAKGAGFESATAPFPVVLCTRPQMEVTAQDNEMLKSMGVAEEPVTASRAADALKKARPQAPPATHMERALKTEGMGQAIGT